MVTLAVAAVVVLAVEVEVAQPFRVPTSSMEPTLHCAKPGIGCTGKLNDRVIVAKLVYRWRDPRRGEIAVFHAPPRAKQLCTEGGTYLKRVIGLPG
ncbi:MAG: signal peptidase I, partial [Solirubrobacterales bacterium]